jgi:hypothetical protein
MTLFAASVFAELTPDSPVVRDWMRQDGRTSAPDADYIQSRQKRRDERLKTLKAAFPKIVFTKHFDLGGSHYAYTEAQSDAQAERNFEPGTALCLLELNGDGEYSERTLIRDPNGVIRDPAVSYDGKTIVFAWKKSNFLDDYHLYDYDVESGKIRQLTFGLGYADYEPCLLPNGDIVFNSTRCVQIVDCWWTEVSNLYRCDKDGRFLRRLSFDQVHTNFPDVLEDGRIIYTRWDYNDRGQIFPQGLFQMNPDGTAQTEYYGNNSYFPTSLLHARGIPNSGGKAIAVFSGHHCRQYGKLGIIDVTKGRQENSGTQLIAPIRETKAERIDAWGQQGDRFAFPYPVNEHEFLTGYNSDTNAKHSTTSPFGIYWIDENGQRELLAYDPSVSSHQPVPLAARAAPYERTTMANHDVNYGAFTIQDVYAGPGLKGIERGKAKTLRVIALDFRSVGIGKNGNGGPAGGALISTPISTGNGTWDVKIPLGDSPIYEDGSASFRVPAKTPLYFQILDENGHAIQTMRSWSTLQPGEVFSCIGCHEDKNTIVSTPAQTIALQKGTQPLKPFYGKPRGFHFDKEIQPILDKHCVECHHDAQRKPDFARAKTIVPSNETTAFSLKGDKVKDLSAKRYWSLSYLNLTNSHARDGEAFSGKQTPVVNWINVQESPAMLPPYRSGAAKSGLMKMLDPKLAADGKTHFDVKLAREELDKIAAWIDLLVPAYGDYKEGNLWDEQELQKYAYYETKRRDMHELDVANNLRWSSYLKDGKQPNLPQEQNVYRNLAGDFSETSLGRQVNFEKPVKTDQVAIVLHADFSHNMKECTIECSNGFAKKISLQKTAEKQIFTFPAQDNVTWLRLTNFIPEQENVGAALTEVEVYGIGAK